MAQTGQSNVRWSLYVYPWEPNFPSGNASTSSKLASAVSSLAGASGNTGNPGTPAQKVRITKGIHFITFQRNKNFHDNTLRIVFRGPVHPTIIIGNWVCLKSMARLEPSGDLQEETETKINQVSRVPIPRFIGQITDVQPEYEKNPETGKISQVTSVTVREWSHVFNAEIRFDEAVIVQSIGDIPGADFLLVQQQNSLTVEQMSELASKVLNPFEFVHLVLSLIGGVASNQSLMDSSVQGIKLPPLALRLPVIPKTLIDDLGAASNPLASLLGGQIPSLSIGDSGADSFSAGFSTTITGVLKGPLHNDGQWNGLFKSGEIDKMATGGLYNNKPGGRPVTAGLAPIITQGLSAWQIFQNTCDPDFNEVFTDMLYEESSDGKSIVAKPVLWVRDKPFAVKSLFNSKDGLSAFGEWSKYDDLPRLYIPQAYIEKVSFHSTLTKAYNYIKVEFLPGVIKDDATRSLSTLKGTMRERQDEMARFGGNALFAKTNYVSQEFFKTEGALSAASNIANSLGAAGNAMWFEQLKQILDVWWGEYYKAPSAVMTIKDYSVPISIGLNLTWIMGDIQLVGHVTGVNTTVTIDESGRHSTQTMIILDRVMKTIGDPVKTGQQFGLPKIGLNAPAGMLLSKLDSKIDLEFIDPAVLNNIMSKPSAQSLSIKSVIPNISIPKSQDEGQSLDKLGLGPDKTSLV